MAPKFALTEISPLQLVFWIASLLAVPLFILVHSSKNVRRATIFAPTGGDLPATTNTDSWSDEMVLSAEASYSAWVGCAVCVKEFSGIEFLFRTVDSVRRKAPLVKC